MTNSNDTIGNQTRDQVAQCLNQMRHRLAAIKQKAKGNPRMAAMLLCYLHEYIASTKVAHFYTIFYN